MNCNTPESWSQEDFTRMFRLNAVRSGVPLSGSIELTSKCNLRCMHCYISDLRDNRDELSKEAWFNIIDEIVAAGCLFLVITGGEPLVSGCFKEIYRHAKKSGLLVTVFTNATMIDEALVDLFRDLRPRSIEVTVYGGTRQTYERMTRVAGSFDKCMAGLDLLHSAGLPLRLKTVMTSENRHEIPLIAGIAERYGVQFYFDAQLFPKFNGDITPVALRVTPEEAVAVEARLAAGHTWWEKAMATKCSTDSPRLYQCGAGVTGFHIDAFGGVGPCVMMPWVRHQWSRSQFGRIWSGLRAEMAALTNDQNRGCASCDMKNFCGYCPAFFRLESGSENTRSEYLCAMGMKRVDMLEKKHNNINNE